MIFTALIIGAAHLVLTYSLAKSDVRRASRLQGHGYDTATMVLGFISAVLMSSSLLSYSANIAAGLLIGVSFAFLLALGGWWISGKRLVGFSRRGKGLMSFLITFGVATGEELIWRFLLPVTLLIHGAPWIVALALPFAGFVVLHLFRRNWHVIPYISAFAFIAALLSVIFGIFSSIFFHIAHNFLVELSVTYSRSRGEVTPVLESEEW